MKLAGGVMAKTRRNVYASRRESISRKRRRQPGGRWRQQHGEKTVVRSVLLSPCEMIGMAATMTLWYMSECGALAEEKWQALRQARAASSASTINICQRNINKALAWRSSVAYARWRRGVSAARSGIKRQRQRRVAWRQQAYGINNGVAHHQRQA